ncbi:hypothetical protein L345_09291, partial [Ophiophagus hannah]
MKFIPHSPPPPAISDIHCGEIVLHFFTPKGQRLRKIQTGKRLTGQRFESLAPWNRVSSHEHCPLERETTNTHV